MQSDLIRVNGDIAAHQSMIERHEVNFLSDNVEEYLDSMPEIQEQRKEVIRYQLALDEAKLISATSTDHPVLARLRRDLEFAEQSFQAKRASLKPAIEQRLKDKARARASFELVTLQAQLPVLQEQEKRLRVDIDKYTKEAEQIGKSSIDVEVMRSEIAHVEKVGEELGREMETLRVELRSPSRVVLIQTAEVPRKKDGRLRMGASSLAGLLGLLVPVCGLCWLDARAQRVNSTREVTQQLGLRVIGSVPRVSPRDRQGLIVREASGCTYKQNMLRESLDTIRTMLIAGTGYESLRVVLITSAMDGEGKTTTATQLAMSFARGGHKTLLLDFDLRQPAAHQVFSMPLGYGISEVLRGEASLADVTRSTHVNNLSIISAGQSDEIAVGSLSRSPNLQRLFQQLKMQYDFVIVDCSPILPVVDGMLIGQHVDAAVLSILRDVSRLPAIYAARERLASLKVRLVGAVVTGADATWASNYGRDYAVIG